MDKLTDEQIKMGLALEANATPGPWFEQYEYDGERTICQMRSTDTTFCVNRAIHASGDPWDAFRENGRLIAFARNYIGPALLELDELRAEVARLKEKRYPCAHPGCTTMRTKEEGGECFTMCDEHWNAQYDQDSK